MICFRKKKNELEMGKLQILLYTTWIEKIQPMLQQNIF